MFYGTKYQPIFGDLYDIISWTIVFPCWMIIQYMYLSKIWLLYYDMRLTKIQNNREWRMIIDPKSSDKIGNKFKLFLNNQNLLYRSKPLLRMTIICMITEYSIQVLLLLIDEWYGIYFGMVLLGIRIIIGIYIWYQMSLLKLIDIFGLRKEIFYSVFIGIFIIIIQVIVVFMYIFYNLITEGDLITWYAIVIAIGIGYSITIHYPLTLHNMFEYKKTLQYGYSNGIMNKTTVPVPSQQVSTAGIGIGRKSLKWSQMKTLTFSSGNNNDNNNNLKIPQIVSNVKSAPIINHWSQIVEHEIGYEEFMNHLSAEFSTENLLFITEVCLIAFVFVNTFFAYFLVFSFWNLVLC